MKIYMISFQRGENYGSVLQAKALQDTFLQLGADAYLLRYYPERWTISYRLKHLEKKKAALKNPLLKGIASAILLPSFKKRKKIFDRFVATYCKEFGPSFSSLDEAMGKFDDADAYSAGSDQIWNSHWNFGIDKCFYLGFAPKDKLRFSYAASIGLDKIPDEEINETKSLLSNFDYISVREAEGVGIVKSLGRNDVAQVLDPTLLKSQEYWSQFIKKEAPKDDYVLTYNIHHDHNIDLLANELARKHHLKVYNISYNWHDIARKGKLIWCPEVEDFLRLIKYAKYVVADSFHATAFSIIFKKQFVTITPEIASSRISSILKLLGIPERQVYKYTDTDVMETQIDYQMVSQNLKAEQNKSLEFIKMVFNDSKITLK